METKHIAVVEDVQNEINRLKRYFESFSSECGVDFQITPFNSAELFLTHYRPVYDLVLMDIMLPGMNGIELAKKMREARPEMQIIFLTGYPQYALEAYDVHPSGYLLKPVKKDRLSAELDYAVLCVRRRQPVPIEAHTFGNFDLLVDGKPIAFRQAKCKELLAYLIDRHGASVTRREAFAVLWEDRMYDRPMQKQLDTIIRLLRASLTDYGIVDLFELKSAAMRINPDLLSCDAWRYLAGEEDAIRLYRGEYMSNYSWATFIEGNLNRRK